MLNSKGLSAQATLSSSASPKRKPRLCIITQNHWEAVMGGAEYQIKLLVNHLLAAGHHEVHYLAQQVNPEFIAQGYSIIQIPEIRGTKRYRFLFEAPHLLSILKEVRPDLIYQRVGCAYTGIAAYYANRYGVRMLWHIAGDADITPLDRKRLRNLMPHRWLEKKFLEHGLTHADLVVAQTRHQAELMQTHYRRSPTAVISNFHPYPEEQLDKSGPITIVWIANFKQLKRPHLFVKLAAELASEVEARFLMIGAAAEGVGWLGKLEAFKANTRRAIGLPANSADWGRQLRAEIAKLPNLDYLGKLAQKRVNEILARAHLLVSTSESEGFSNTFIQAWMREVPVVSLEVNPDGIFDDGKLGLVSGNYENLCRDVLRLVHNPRLRAEMGSYAREYALRHHSQANLLELVDLLEV
jgi:glycosyltransferase involved in cell wall biosynthesis